MRAVLAYVQGPNSFSWPANWLKADSSNGHGLCVHFLRLHAGTCMGLIDRIINPSTLHLGHLIGISLRC